MQEATMAKILGIGELLWDVFPDGRKLGGAPANFAYQCRQLGHDAYAVSRVGIDELGDEIVREFQRRGLSTQYVDRDADHPTGTVTVTMTGTSHTFTIVEDVAWDHLRVSPEWLSAAGAADAVCFGSVAQRASASRGAIQQIVAAAKGLRVCDVNLRQAFFCRETIEQSLTLANVLKLNDDEMGVLDRLLEIHAGSLLATARAMIDRYALTHVCITRGSAGAMLIFADGVAECRGEKIDRVIDTVGCGDAFCAAMVDGLLKKLPPKMIIERANRLGAFVATQAGGMPKWSEDIRRDMDA
jgi:fructokinase